MNEIEIEAGLATTPGYQYADQVGAQLFIAGQVPHDTNGQLIGINNPYQQARQCLDNLSLLLNVHGFSSKDIRKLVIYVVGDRSHLTEAWAAVKAQFSEGVPPATLLGVAALGHKGQLVEIDATIIKT